MQNGKANLSTQIFWIGLDERTRLCPLMAPSGPNRPSAVMSATDPKQASRIAEPNPPANRAAFHGDALDRAALLSPPLAGRELLQITEIGRDSCNL